MEEGSVGQERGVLAPNVTWPQDFQGRQGLKPPLNWGSLNQGLKCGPACHLHPVDAPGPGPWQPSC